MLVESDFKVVSFTMGTMRDGDWIPKFTKGNRFSDEMIELIKNSRRGQKFFFENIEVVYKDGAKRTLNPINLTILE